MKPQADICQTITFSDSPLTGTQPDLTSAAETQNITSSHRFHRRARGYKRILFTGSHIPFIPTNKRALEPPDLTTKETPGQPEFTTKNSKQRI